MQIPQYLLKATKASIKASKAIMEIYNDGFKPTYKTDGSPVTIADFASSKILMDYLEQTEIPIISEEVDKESYEIRKDWKRVWIVDPLDGTKEFIRRNDEFVICIALVENGNPSFGIITHPVSETVLMGGEGYGAFTFTFEQIETPVKWIQLQPQPLNDPLILSSSRTPYKTTEVALIEELEARFKKIEYSKKGSALKFFDLAEGKSDIYPRFAPTMEWDIAAGHAIIKAIGGTVIEPTTKLPLTYNKKSLYNPHFIVYTKQLKDLMLP